MSGFRATITAVALLPAAHVKNLTAAGEGESKPAARTAAEMNLREQINTLRQEHGPRVALHFADAPIFEEIEHA